MTDAASTAPPIAVTGATGALGGRVAHRLASLGVAQRLVVRDPSRAPQLPGAGVARADYDDVPALTAALRGARTLLLVSAAEHAQRVQQHRRAVDAAVAARVERVVYTSFLAAAPDAVFTLGRDHWHTEEYLRASGLRWTALRDSLYADFLPLIVGADGVLRGPAGDGRVAAVARDDVADVAVAVLLDEKRGREEGEVFALTGPEALTLTEVAETITRETGRPVRYHAETIEEAYASRAGYGAQPFEVDGWVSSYTSVAAGEMDVVSPDVERLAGHPARSLAEVLHAL